MIVDVNQSSLYEAGLNKLYAVYSHLLGDYDARHREPNQVVGRLRFEGHAAEADALTQSVRSAWPALMAAAASQWAGSTATQILLNASDASGVRDLDQAHEVLRRRGLAFEAWACPV